MELYLLKSAACLAILLVFYKAFLEKESFHVFKRFYLLIGLLIAFSIPLVTFTYYVEASPIMDSTSLTESQAIPFVQKTQEQIAFNWSVILWSIYAMGVLFFGLRFLLNLSRIANRIVHNQKLKHNKFINVLLTDLVIPHTFFNYIFLNKSKFEQQEIPEEVLLHEQAHAQQRHTIDILLIESLQIMFWFNPLIYILKHAVKLNHEFLADKAVMNQGVSPSTYQQLILAFSSNAATPQLANAINYSSIKKRFTVMKTKTSQKTVWLKSLVLLPLLAVMVFGFSTTEEVVKEIEPPIDNHSASKHTARSIDLKILSNGNYSVDGIKVAKNELAATVNTLHQDITPEIRNNIMNIHVSSSKEISNNEVWFIYNALLDYGFYRIVTPNQEVNRGKGNTPFKMMSMDANDSPEIIDQKSASRDQMAEYNKLAIHYNTMLNKKKDITIKMKHVERMKYIYGIMSDKQRKDAEPFPDFPKPPPPPEAPAVMDVEVPMAPPPPPIPADATPTQKAKYRAVIANYAKKHPNSVSKVKNADGELIEVVEVPTAVLAPPPPPPPPNPIKHMKQLAQEGATFYYEGKKINSKEAIKIVQENDDINIQVQDHESDKPIVKLSTKPIRLKKHN